MADIYAAVLVVSALLLAADAADLPKTRLHRSAYVGGPNGWDQFYVVHLDLGTPRQTFFNLTMDFTNSGLFLFGSEPKKNPCSKTLPTRLYFDKTKSSTIKGPLSSYNYNFWQSYVCNIHDSVFDGNIYIDDWTVEGHPFSSIPFVLVNDGATGLNPQWPSDGILGLAAVDPVNPLPLPAYSGVKKVLSQLPEPVLTIYMDHSDDPQLNATFTTGGQITWGGKDTEHCDGKWTQVQKYQDGLWSLNVTSVSLGKYSHKYAPASPAGFMPASEYIVAPYFEAADIMAAIPVKEYDTPTAQWKIDCAKVPSLPDLVFTFVDVATGKDFEYNIPAREYARPTGVDPPGTCTIRFQTNLVGEFWELGTTFNRPYCTLLDYGSNTISFAKAIPSST